MTALWIDLVFKSSLLVGGGACVALLLGRRGSAASRHLVWTLVIAGVLLLPLFSLWMPRWEIQIPVKSPAAATSSPTAATRAVSTTPRVQPASRLDDSAVSVSPARHTANISAESSDFSVITMLPITVYTAGVLLLIARVLRQRHSVTRLARTSSVVTDSAWTRLLATCSARIGVPHSVRLLRSPHHTVPMAFGIWAPAIVVPSAADMWDEDRRRAVLLHELAHIVRRDCAVQMLTALACALYWFHPGVWWSARRLRDESELACDDRVLTAGTESDAYAGHLLELAYACVGHRAPALAVSMARPSQIESRLRAILDSARNRRSPAKTVSACAAIAAAIILAIVAAARTSLVPVAAQAPTDPNRLAAQQTSPQSPRVDPGTRAIADGQPGAWEIWTSGNGVAEVRFSERHGSWNTMTTDIKGLKLTDGPVQRTFVRDAGTFTLEGVFRSGVGAGTFTFAPSDTFPGELAKRGFAMPTRLDQYLLARSDVGFAFIDEVAAQKYSRPDLAQLVRAADHGITLSYLREMSELGYRLGNVERLILTLDHGVSPQFVRELRALGFTAMSADDLVRTRDHGVDAGYIKAMADIGYARLSIEEAIRARDHGVDVDYVRDLRQSGYQLGLEDTVNARDHGVDTGYIKDMAQLGYSKLSMPELVNARDHGVDAQYAREMRELGYQVALTDLIKTRDHGVDTQYIRDLTSVGYKGLSLEQLIQLRDHGVDANYVRELKTLGVNAPRPDDLIRLRDSGFTRGRLKVELGYRFQRMRQQLERMIAMIN